MARIGMQPWSSCDRRGGDATGARKLPSPAARAAQGRFDRHKKFGPSSAWVSADCYPPGR